MRFEACFRYHYRATQLQTIRRFSCTCFRFTADDNPSSLTFACSVIDAFRRILRISLDSAFWRQACDVRDICRNFFQNKRKDSVNGTSEIDWKHSLSQVYIFNVFRLSCMQVVSLGMCCAWCLERTVKILF